MLEQFYDPKLGLFQLTETDKTFIVSRKSASKPQFKEMFEMYGKVIGKALFERIPSKLSVHQSLYK